MPPTFTERKLAAILSADVVGYSRLMAEDEAGTVRTLNDYREETEVLLRQHRGRLVDFTGDNFLAEFPTALDAVECAAEVQRVLRARNAGLPEGRRMEFRMGVHLGDVTVEGERIYGDGVNIAARLEGLAEPGGVCISTEVLSQIRRKLQLDFEDLGEQTVKNIPDPVHAYLLRERATEAMKPPRRSARWIALAAGLAAVLGVGAWWFWQEEAGLGSPGPVAEPGPADQAFTVPGYGDVPAIAVLPFDNLSRDPEQEYLVDGMVEELITRLSSNRLIPVIARNSSFTYKERAVDVKQVSRELGARYVVEGSVRRVGDRVRITAQLIDGTTARHLWAESYERELKDIFALQDDITEAIVAEVSPQLVQAETTRATQRGPRNLDAYQLTLQGMWHVQRGGPENLARAQSLAEQALELDPEYEPALGLLTNIYILAIHGGWTDSLERTLDDLERTAQACVAADARSPHCQLSLAWAHQLRGRRRDWIAALERARRLDPPVGLVGGIGVQLAVAGKPEQAIEMLDRAIRLSPHDPEMWMFVFSKGMAHFVARRYAEAVEWFLDSLSLHPEYNVTYRQLAASYALMGRADDAREAMDEALRLEPDVTIAKVRKELIASDPDYLRRYLDGLRQAGMPED